MKLILKGVSITLLTFILMLGVGDKSFADSNGIPFTVEPVLPENQDEGVGSYISISPEESSFSQELQFKISNESNIEQEVEMTVLNSYTSPNGVIQYVEEESDNSEITDDNYQLAKHLTTESDKITLKPEETKVITAFVDVSDIEGSLLGGVGFSATEEGQKQEKDDGSFQINNKINMIIGVMLNFDTDKTTEFILGEPTIDPMPSYYAVRLPIELSSPMLVQNTKINYQVFHKNTELFGDEKEINFAPYSKTNIAIPFEYEEIKENETYNITGQLIYTDEKGNETTKDFEKNFKYNKDKKKDSQNDEEKKTLKAPIEKGDFPLWVIPLGFMLVLALFFVVWQTRKNDK